MARQNVHALGAGYSRQKLHRKRGDAGFRHRANRILMAIGVHRRDHERAGLEMLHFRRVRAADLQNQIRAERFFSRDEPRAGRLILGVGEPRFGACAMLDRDLRPEANEFLDRLRGRRDARFIRVRFRGRSDQHETFPDTVDVRRDGRPFGVGAAELRPISRRRDSLRASGFGPQRNQGPSRKAERPGQ